MVFKKTMIWSLVFLFMLTLSGCGWFGGGEEKKVSGDTDWQFEKKIITPISATSTSQADVNLGDLTANEVSIVVPKGSFDADTQISLTNPDSVPQYYGNEIQTLGAPIEISVGQPTRLNEPVEVTFKFDVAKLPANYEKSRLRVMYFSGDKWEYIRPKNVDIEKGTMTFDTFHFSLFGGNHVNDDTKITEAWIHSKVLDDKLREQINDKSDFVAEQIIDLTLKKMGIEDESLKGKVLGELLKEDGYKDIADAYNSGDMVDMNQKIALLAGKKIAENVDDSIFKEALGNLVEGAEDVAAVSQAAGMIAGGDVQGAAKLIGETIADKFLITTAAKIGVEMVEYQIESWKNNEVEAAFRAYKDGANGVFYGYNVDPGDFDTIWNQMRGIRRQLEIEAIKKENEVRAESGMPPLTERQEEGVRTSVYNSYKRQFKERSELETQQKEDEQKYLSLIDAFKTANFFDSTYGPTGLDKGFDYEGKLDVLYHFAQKMMKDTGRFDLSTKMGLIMKDKIALDDIVQGARYYFSGPEGKAAYAKYLKDRFNIDLYPDLKDLAGKWNQGSMTINDVIMPEKPASSDGASGGAGSAGGLEGCDFNMDLSVLKGQTVPFDMTLTPTSDVAGNMTILLQDAEPIAMPFTYEAGTIKGSFTKEGATATLNVVVSEGDKIYNASGSLNIAAENDTVKILTTVNITKAMPEPATAKTK
jgi:hypothetical protein